MPRRYGLAVIPYSTRLQPGTLAALDALVASGARSECIDRAIRTALTQLQRRTGAAGALPAERLEAIAQALDDQAAALRRHAASWGDPVRSDPGRAGAPPPREAARSPRQCPSVSGTS